MSFSKLTESKNKSKSKSKSNITFENLSKGACVKIKNSQKTFQVVGINFKNKICWIREWPFDLEAKKTFSCNKKYFLIRSYKNIQKWSI